MPSSPTKALVALASDSGRPPGFPEVPLGQRPDLSLFCRSRYRVLDLARERLLEGAAPARRRLSLSPATSVGTLPAHALRRGFMGSTRYAESLASALRRRRDEVPCASLIRWNVGWRPTSWVVPRFTYLVVTFPVTGSVVRRM
jgi:hypothetical protein